MKWYILQSLSGQEKKVAESIREKAEKEGLSECIGDIVVPTEKVKEVRKGKKIDVERRFLPGYILLQVDMRDELWHVITTIPRVGKFLGSKGKPQEVTETEVKNILEQIKVNAVEREQLSVFEVGDSVKINDGPFESFVGNIEGIDESKKRLKVMVTIFGRSTPVDLGFNQVTKEE